MVYVNTIIIALVCASAAVQGDTINFDDEEEFWNNFINIENNVIKNELDNHKWIPQLPKKTNVIYHNDIKGLAEVDSCFCSSDEVYWMPCSDKQINEEGCSNRTSESYAWGMARTEDRVFWGTIANEQCLETPGDYQTPSGVYCSDKFENNWKIPSVYMYDIKADQYIKISDQLKGIDYERLNTTGGLRAAGIRNGVAILAGFATDKSNVYMFGFDAITGKFLASIDFENSNDVRKFTYDINYDMYVGISKTDGSGDVWRYTGNIDNPLSFELIAHLSGSPEELSFYNNYLVAATWAGTLFLEDLSNYTPAFMAISPLPADEMPAIATYTHKDKNIKKNNIESDEWKTIWSISQYEPDPFVQYSYGVSVNMQIGEWLYWGTVQYPVGAVKLIQDAYPDVHVDTRTGQKATHRSMTFFRGRNFLTNNPDIELLYGDIILPVYQPDTNSWSWKPNGCPVGQKVPKFGRAGFGNIYNMYLWSMNWLNGYLLIGTFDSFGITSFSYFFPPNMPYNLGYSLPNMGADMYLMKVDADGSISPAEMITLGGFDNPSNFGFRNIVVNEYNSSASTVFIGTANIYNANPRGGWEVFEMELP